MLTKGQTIVYHYNGKVSFYWFVIEKTYEYVFFNWLGNPNNPTPKDYWRQSKTYIDDCIKNGTIEVYNGFPIDYESEMFRQAEERNMNFS